MSTNWANTEAASMTEEALAMRTAAVNAAFDEAKRRWPEKPGIDWDHPKGEYMVGITEYLDGVVTMPLGIGTSWEEAFAKADQCACQQCGASLATGNPVPLFQWDDEGDHFVCAGCWGTWDETEVACHICQVQVRRCDGYNLGDSGQGNRHYVCWPCHQKLEEQDHPCGACGAPVAWARAKKVRDPSRIGMAGPPFPPSNVPACTSECYETLCQTVKGAA